jgi:hypothetical protein
MILALSKSGWGASGCTRFTACRNPLRGAFTRVYLSDIDPVGQAADLGGLPSMQTEVSFWQTWQTLSEPLDKRLAPALSLVGKFGHNDNVWLWLGVESRLENRRQSLLTFGNPCCVMLPDDLLGIAEQLRHIAHGHAGALQ